LSGLDENQSVNDNRVLGYQVNGKPSAATPILQFNETTKSFDWVAISGGSMGDLEFIESKVLAGDYFQVSGDISTLNDTIEYVVPNGKTAFLLEAKIVNIDATTPIIISGTTIDSVRAALKIDTVTKDTTRIGFSSSAITTGTTNSSPAQSAYGNLGDGKFNVKGLSLVGNNAKKIEIENILDDGSVFATMSGYLIGT